MAEAKKCSFPESKRVLDKAREEFLLPLLFPGTRDTTFSLFRPEENTHPCTLSTFSFLALP